MADSDREYFSQYSAAVLGVLITVNGLATDADGAVNLQVVNEDTQQSVFSRAATREGLGQYAVDLTTDDTMVTANFTALWNYQVGGATRVTRSFYAVGGPELFYDSLDTPFKAIVDQVWTMFADQFDSPTGGPHLRAYSQSNWSKSRAAQMMIIGIQELNTIAQPHSTFTLDGVGGPVFPVATWGGLLLKVAYIEALKHLQRSYMEMPNITNAPLTLEDRQQYFDRYGQLIDREQLALKRQLDTFKISQFNMTPSILLSGGVFGRTLSGNMPYYAAARPSLWAIGAY